MSKDILYTREGQVGKITLNRPQLGNSLDLNTIRSLIDAFKQSDANGDVCVIYTAKGKDFTYGADLKYGHRLLTEPGGLEEAVEFQAAFQDLTRAMRIHGGILIAGLKGLVIGGGFEICLSCDLRIAARDTTLMLPELALGTMFSNATTKLLPRIVGEGRAKEILLLAKNLSAKEAYTIGLVNQLCEPDELDALLDQYTKELTEKEPYALKTAKQLINSNQDIDIESTLEKEQVAMINCGISKGFKTRLKAFVEKNK